MQGKKNYQEKFFVNFRLSERIPSGNFYKRLKECIDLEYLRPLTSKYYGIEGHKSIDPVVFFKLMLVGYLDNICSDRKIIEQCALRLDVLYFLGYDIDEPLPWHSTLSRTRKLFGEDVFLSFFRDILRKCVEKGMVNGKQQAVDSALIKANASMDSLDEIELEAKSKKYFDEITYSEDPPISKDKPSDGKPCKSSGGRGCNERHASKTDPEARVSQKPGKAPALYHLGIISVDTESHVICGATVDYADKRDCQTTENIVGQTVENLSENSIAVEELLADAAYSSGHTYRYLASRSIRAYIPACGRYKPQREGFAYDKEADCYVCSKGVKLKFRGLVPSSGGKIFSRMYCSSSRDCRGCPQKEQCCKGKSYKRQDHSADKQYYDAAYEITNSYSGKRKMRLRSATVEPVLGTLLCFRRMKKLYTIGQELARKQFLMAAAAYNLKKLMNVNMHFKGIASVENKAKNAVYGKIRKWHEFILFNSWFRLGDKSFLYLTIPLHT
jgi:transposase